MQPALPSNFGPYLIRDKIGSGGMATVYRAFDPARNQDVALKVLSIHLTTNDNIIKRFKREAEALRQLDHPNILPIYDYDGDNDPPYIVMRLMSGQSLANLLESGQPLDPALVSRYVRQIASALDYAHAHHVIHRDIKPSNILFDLQGNPYLSDFGVAFVEDGGTRLTSDGGFIGTVHYASPEQCKGETPVAASDIYSLAVMAFQMLTGQALFDGPTPLVVMRKHLGDAPPNPISINPRLPVHLYSVLAKALAKLPENRYSTAMKFSQAMDDALGLPAYQQTMDDQTWLTGQVPMTAAATTAAATFTDDLPSQLEPGTIVAGELAPDWLEPEDAPEKGTVVSSEVAADWLEPDAAKSSPIPYPGLERFAYIKAPVPSGDPSSMGKSGLYFIIAISLLLLAVAAVMGYDKWGTTPKAESPKLDATYHDLDLSVKYPDDWTAQTASSPLLPGSSSAIILSDHSVSATEPYGNADIVILIQPVDAASLFAVPDECPIGGGPENVFDCMTEQGLPAPAYESADRGILLRGTLPPTSTTYPMILLPRDESSWLALIIVQWDDYADARALLADVAASVQS
jgi:serine/threonine protein kinase